MQTKICKCGRVTEVRDSRVSSDGLVYRRRECKACNTRYTTYEVPRGHIEHLRRQVKEFETFKRKLSKLLEK